LYIIADEENIGDMTLENWLRNKLQENEEMHDYAVATDTLRCWMDEYNELNQPNVVEQSEELCIVCKTGSIGNDYGCTNTKCECYPFKK
jgi:hypothetical protein